MSISPSDGPSENQTPQLATINTGLSENTSPLRIESHPPRVIEYRKVRAFGFIGDGKVRVIPNDGPVFSIQLSDDQIALLIEDCAKYLREKIINAK